MIFSIDRTISYLSISDSSTKMYFESKGRVTLKVKRAAPIRSIYLNGMLVAAPIDTRIGSFFCYSEKLLFVYFRKMNFFSIYVVTK